MFRVLQCCSTVHLLPSFSARDSSHFFILVNSHDGNENLRRHFHLFVWWTLLLQLCHGLPWYTLLHHLFLNYKRTSRFTSLEHGSTFHYDSLATPIECWWHARLHSVLLCYWAHLCFRAWTKVWQWQNSETSVSIESSSSDYVIFITSIKRKLLGDTDLPARIMPCLSVDFLLPLHCKM